MNKLLPILLMIVLFSCKKGEDAGVNTVTFTATGSPRFSYYYVRFSNGNTTDMVSPTNTETSPGKFKITGSFKAQKGEVVDLYVSGSLHFDPVITVYGINQVIARGINSDPYARFKVQ